MIKLRDYQEQALEAIEKALARGVKKQVLNLATGLGKTIVFAELLRRRGKTALVLAHRDELIQQAEDKIRFVYPEAEIGVVKAERNEKDANIVVASIQSLHEKRLKQWEPDRFHTVVIDEAHHAIAPSYKRVIDHFNPELLLGVTATPFRGDRVTLAKVFDEVVYSYGILEGIRNKYLVDIEAYRVQTNVDLDSVKTNAGDFNLEELSERVNVADRNEAIVQAYVQYAGGKKALVFAVDIEHAVSLTETFRRAGINAAFVHGGTPKEERRSVLEGLKTGEIPVVVNVSVLTEGFDEPSVEVVILARPTKSLTLFCLDEATEILTDVGWRGINDSLNGVRAAGFDITTGEVCWTEIIGRIERPLYPGERMYSLVGPSLDIRVTDQHRMLWRSRRARSKEWNIATATELANRNSEYLIPISGVQKAAGVPLTDDEIRFIGWFITDGTINKITNSISITQAEHQPTNAAIRACLEGCGFKYSVYRDKASSQFNRRSPLLRYTVSKGMPRGNGKHLRGWGALEPYLDKNLSPLLEDLDARQLGVLLEAMHLGNGSKQENQSWTRRSYHIFTANQVLADRLQSLCVRRGYKCNISPISYNKSPGWMLHIKKTSVRNVGGATATDRPVLCVDSSKPGERVWCVETGTGTIITRRNGKVSILGNCQMVGRGTRLAPGKERLILLDVTDNTKRHRVVSVKEMVGLKNPVKQGRRITEAVLEEEKNLPEIRKFISTVFPTIEVEKVPDLLVEFSDTSVLPDYDWRDVLGELEELREDEEMYAEERKRFQTWGSETFDSSMLRVTDGQKKALEGFGWPKEEIMNLTRFEASFCIERHMEAMRDWSERKAKLWGVILGVTSEEAKRYFNAPWQLKPMTERQLKVLKREKIILPPGDFSAGEVAIILDKIFSNKKNGDGNLAGVR